MSSTYKTNYLGLNKFVGTDKPKMEDFNFDNEQLDSELSRWIMRWSFCLSLQQGRHSITSMERSLTFFLRC